MTRIRSHCIAVSLDGFLAGPDQTADAPMGRGGHGLHEWFFADPRDPVDDEVLAELAPGFGATVMGRNMFGPVRGPWPDDSWRGWWGSEPPYGHPVFVLTHHPRPDLPMDGGTTFHFVTSLDEALARAREAAGPLDVKVAGGASVLRQCLRAGALDELSVVVVPVLLGTGERLLDEPVLADWRVARTRRAAVGVHHRLVRPAPG